MSDEDQRLPAADYPDGPLPNRLTRGTLTGCLGLAGVLALPLVLFLPLETWGLARWAFLGIQLLAFCALGSGIRLLARVPSATRARSDDPLRPLTARGAAPVLERPATWPNKIGLAVVATSLAIGAIGFVVAAFAGQQNALPLGMAVACIAGVILAAYGVCVTLGTLEPPAFRWVRRPVTRSWLPQGGSVMLLGLTLLAWALLIAAEARFVWGAIGLMVLLGAVLLIAPAFRAWRQPAREHRDER